MSQKLLITERSDKPRRVARASIPSAKNESFETCFVWLSREGEARSGAKRFAMETKFSGIFIIQICFVKFLKQIMKKTLKEASFADSTKLTSRLT